VSNGYELAELMIKIFEKETEKYKKLLNIK